MPQFRFRPWMFIGGGFIIASITVGATTAQPSFTGYHWPAHDTVVYQIHWSATSVQGNTTSTLSWNPSMLITTGNPSATGIPVTLRLNASPLLTRDAPGLPSSNMQAIKIGTITLYGTVNSNGRLIDRTWMLPARHPAIPASALEKLLPLNVLLPPVSPQGWTGGHSYLAAYPWTRLALGGVWFVSRQSAVNLPLTEKVSPQLQHHDWAVRTTIHTPQAIPVDFPLAASGSNHPELTPGSLRINAADTYLLSGTQGGIIKSMQSEIHATITMSHTIFAKITVKLSIAGKS
jgi:hypothetical protein